MSPKKLHECFSGFARVEGVDFSILFSDMYGNSLSSTWGEINDIYSEESKGIFLREWFKSKINSEWIKDFESMDKAYVSHRLNEDLAKEFYRIFSKYYDISPEAWDDNKSFILIEK